MGLIAPNKANSPAKVKKIDKSKLKNRALEMLSQEEEDYEGHTAKVIDQILARAANTARYAKSDKDATSAGKWLWEIAFGKSPVAVEETQDDMTEVVIRVNPKNKALLEAAKDRDDYEDTDENELNSQFEVDIEEEDTILRFK